MTSNERKIKTRVRNAYMVSTISIALVLFLLGSVGYLILNARKASDNLREGIAMSVLLKDGVSADGVKEITSKLQAMEAVKQVEYVSKDAAAEDFKAYVGNDFVTFLDGNPLPASLEITVNSEFSTPEAIKALVAEVSKWDGVDEIIYQGAIIEQITRNIKKFNFLLLVFGGALLLISLILVNNTIRMAIFSRRYIISTMKLVGATRGFILRPFILKALIQGLCASLIASALLCLTIAGLNRGIPEAGFITGSSQLLYIFGAVLLLGVIISVLFTYSAVRSYVRLSVNKIHIY